jgi:hypothetical protein
MDIEEIEEKVINIEARMQEKTLQYDRELKEVKNTIKSVSEKQINTDLQLVTISRDIKDVLNSTKSIEKITKTNIEELKAYCKGRWAEYDNEKKEKEKLRESNRNKITMDLVEKAILYVIGILGLYFGLKK